MPHVEQLTDDAVQADTAAAIEQLRALGCTTTFTVGFCFGGRASWVAAASGHGLAGAIGFYGSPTRERGGPSVVQRVTEIECPILALQAGDDQGITAEDNAAFEQALYRGRRRARDRQLRRRAAQLLRPQAGAVQGRVRRRVASHARVHRAALTAPR